MLFETQNQFLIAISFLWLGIFIATLYDFFSFKTKYKILNSLTNFFMLILTILIFYFWLTKFAYANLRFYIILSFFVGLILEKIFFYSLIAKYKKMFYTYINKIWNKYKTQHIQLKKEKQILKENSKQEKFKDKLQDKNTLRKKHNSPKHTKRRKHNDRKQIKNTC